MGRNTSITLGDYFENIIQKSINTGRYSSVSEVVRAGLRLIDEEEKKITILKSAIEEGEKSGYVKNFDSKKHLEELSEKYS